MKTFLTAVLCLTCLVANDKYIITGKVLQDKIKLPINGSTIDFIPLNEKGEFSIHVDVNKTFEINAPGFVKRSCIMKEERDIQKITIYLKRISLSKDLNSSEYIELTDGLSCTKLPEHTTIESQEFKTMKPLKLHDIPSIDLRLFKRSE
ncbi:hypothetical protein [Sulfurovum mangrovi]|uniref:hypothetical protein n=1 Tax=Sulfurovum mangrovi TaxID=2893889 RepID=UPI001E61336D|nr:hypothetical protein [Sulfurovum mangrovi]UFH58131.1 hypothetical protein LN246_07180 [Sulfurovum mangrovi]